MCHCFLTIKAAVGNSYKKYEFLLYLLKLNYVLIRQMLQVVMNLRWKMVAIESYSRYDIDKDVLFDIP